MKVLCKYSWLLLAWVCFSAWSGARSQSCQFPAGLRGRNLTSNDVGLVTFSENSLVIHEALKDCTGVLCLKFTSLSFTCQENQGTSYLLRSQDIPDGANAVVLYICWYITTEVSSNKWVYYQGPKQRNTFYNSYVLPRPSTASVSLSEVCNLNSNPLPVDKYNLLLDTDLLTSQSSSCPDALLSTFLASSLTVTSCVTEVDVCSTPTRQTISINDTSCQSDAFFTANGTMDCLHSLSQDNVTYVMTFTPNNETVTFACLAYTQQGSDMFVKLQASVCNDMKTPTASDITFQTVVRCPFPCTFPDAFLGNWINSRTAREVTVTSTILTNFVCSAPPCSGGLNSLECYRSESDKYLLRAAVSTVDSMVVREYMCLQLTPLNATKYLYYQLSENMDTIFNAGQSVSFSEACGDLSSNPLQGTRQHLFVESGNEANSFSACPAQLLGEFNNTDGACQSTYNTCDNDTKLAVTGTSCNPVPFYSAGGSVGCLYSVTVADTTYITLYNTDPTPDGSNTFAFTCVAFKLSGSTLELSQNPLECVDSQTSNFINSTTGGGLVVYEKTGDCPVPVAGEFDFLLIIIIVVVVLVVLILLLVIICIICRKKKASKKIRDQEEAILKKEEEEEDERGSTLSLDSGYPQSGRETRGGGRGSRALGTPRSHIADVYEVAEEQGPKQVNVLSHRRRRHRRLKFEPHEKKEGQDHDENYETDGESNYSDASWEEYVDEEGNAQVRPRRRRQRRRKKLKQTYTRTRILEDGTTVEEEVESEFSVTASSDVTSSDDDRESLTDQIHEEKEKRKARLQKIMERGVPPASHILTRKDDERAHRPERKRSSLLNKLTRRGRDRKSKARVRNRAWHQGKTGGPEVAGVAPEERAVPYLMQFHNKKEIERALNDEGFFDDPSDKVTSETVFGFLASERELSPKPGHVDVDGQIDEERMATATDSSQLEGGPRSHDRSDTIDDFLDETQSTEITKVTSKGKEKHVTIDPSPPSPTPSSDSELKDDDSDRKTSDTSSGVADLSPEHSHAPLANGSKDNRRISLGWEKVQGLYGRNRLGVNGAGGTRDKGEADRQRTGLSKSQQKDKRVKTALRRLLNERLFGSTDKKKSRRDDTELADTWTNADSVTNNVSDTSSTVGTRTATRQTTRPATQGKVIFAEIDPNQNGGPKEPTGPNGTRKVNGLGLGLGLGPIRGEHEDDDSNANNEEIDGPDRQERLPTGGGSRLPPLRTPTTALSRAFTPSNFPKWGLCVTATQRSMLVEGLDRDRTFLSRKQAKAAWGPKNDDSMILPPKSRENGGDEDTTDDESWQDPHRPHTGGVTNSKGEKRGAPLASSVGSHGDHSVAVTQSSCRSPIDIDDRRLKKLLEELYKDKKFMDNLINKIDQEHLEFPDHIASEDVKFMSEFGRSFLLDRANYWEMHGPLGPPKPPPTALGTRLNMTSHGSRHTSHDSVTSPRPKTVR